MRPTTGAGMLDVREAKRRRAEARRQYVRDTYVLWRRNRLMVLGTGIIAGGPVRAIMEAGGVTDVLSKGVGSRSSINIVHAVFDGVDNMMDAKTVAKSRGNALTLEVQRDGQTRQLTVTPTVAPGWRRATRCCASPT